jgi:hypothetical protein
MNIYAVYSLRYFLSVAVDHVTHVDAQLWPLIYLIIYHKKLKNLYFKNIRWNKLNNVLCAQILIPKALISHSFPYLRILFLPTQPTNRNAVI